MKHQAIFSVLAFLSLATYGGGANADAPLSPQLTPAIAAPAAPSSAPTLRLVGRTLQACRPQAGSSVPLCRSGRLPAEFGTVTRAVPLALPAPSGTPTQLLHANPASSKPAPSTARSPSPSPDELAAGADAPPLVMLFESAGQALVCTASGAIVCSRVAAPAPTGVTVDALLLPDGYTAFTYTRAQGVTGAPDPQGQAALRFQAAVDAAATAVRQFLSAHTNAIPHVDDYYDYDPVLDPVPSPGDSGGSGYFVIIVVISAPLPDPIDPGPFFIASGDGYIGIDAIPQLPPRYPDEDLAAVLNPCVISPIMTVCVRGNRPPPPDVVPLPTGPTPWFPQSWCDAFHVLCSTGQEPRDNERGPDSNTSGKTMEELYRICDDINAAEINTCNAIMTAGDGDYRMKRACIERANSRLAACYSAARQLTDNGTHPAP